jgi:pyridoxine 4-dehydrogenase
MKNDAHAFAHGPATIRIGSFEVPRLAFGAMQLPGPGVFGPPKDEAAAKAVLRRVVELGIHLIDTAWFYGPLVSNRLIAETLHPYPKHLVIACKLGGRRTEDKGWLPYVRPEELRKGCEEDLRSLRLERIDIAHLRWHQHQDVPFAEALDAMIAMRDEGKIRHIAVSNVTLAQLDAALARTTIVAVQNLYNTREGEKKLGDFPYASVVDQEKIVDRCADKGLAFLPFFTLALPMRKNEPTTAYRAIMQRHDANEAQIAIAWQLARSPAILPIPGTSSVAHLEENWKARTIALSKDEFDVIAAERTGEA